MSMFNSVPSVLKRYKQLVGLGIASAMLIAIFVPSQNIPIQVVRVYVVFIMDMTTVLVR